MVSGEQHLRDLHPPELRRVRVLRGLKPPAMRKALVRGGRGPAAQRPRKEAHRRVNHRRRRELASGHHKVAERDEVCGQRLDPRVESLVVPAHEDDMALAGELLGHPLVEPPPGGRRHHDPRPRGVRPRAGARLDRLKPRAAHHEHPRPAAIRLVVHLPVDVVREVAQVHDVDLAEALRDRPRDDALLQKPPEHRGLDAYDVQPQHSARSFEPAVASTRSATFLAASGTAMASILRDISARRSGLS